MEHWTEQLTARSACQEAVEYAQTFESFDAAWQACERGDWLLWWIGRQKQTDRKQLVLAACKCARLALPHVQAGELRPLQAIETAERWASGDAAVRLDDVRRASYAAADAAAADVDTAAAAYAAAAAADAAYTAGLAGAAAGAAYAASRATLKQYSDIVREFYPHPPGRA